MSIIDFPGLSDNDRSYLRDGIIERVADIVKEQAEQLVNRMATLGMTAQHKVEPRYGHVELTIMIKRANAEGMILSRMFNTEILTSRKHAIDAVQRDLEIMVRTLFFN